MSRRLLVLVALALLVPAAASAARVGWHETAKIKGVRAMTYTVDSISIRSNGWTAHVSFKNISHKTIRVGSEFGIAFYADPHAEDLMQAIGFASASKFSSKTPTVLKPGDSWAGTIGGSGRFAASGKVWARVVFGPFDGLPGEATAVVWITDHATTVHVGSNTPPPAAGPII